MCAWGGGVGECNRIYRGVLRTRERAGEKRGICREGEDGLRGGRTARDGVRRDESDGEIKAEGREWWGKGH